MLFMVYEREPLERGSRKVRIRRFVTDAPDADTAMANVRAEYSPDGTLTVEREEAKAVYIGGVFDAPTREELDARNTKALSDAVRGR